MDGREAGGLRTAVRTAVRCSNSGTGRGVPQGGEAREGAHRVVKDIEVPPFDVGDRIVVDVGISHG